jgi:hypothetical protein
VLHEEAPEVPLGHVLLLPGGGVFQSAEVANVVSVPGGVACKDEMGVLPRTYFRREEDNYEKSSKRIALSNGRV